MKRLLLLLLLSCSLALAGWPNGYTFRRTVTIDHTKVGASDAANFPVALFGTYSYLATVANGGQVQSSSGFDIIFTSDANGASIVNFDRANYNAATGTVEFHFEAATLSHTVDTVFYLFYANASVTTDQQNAAAVWSADGDYLVMHGGDGATVSIADSAGNNTPTNGLSLGPSAVAGIVGGAMSGGTGARYVDLGSMAGLYNGANTALVVSGWFKGPSSGDGNYSTVTWGSTGTFSGPGTTNGPRVIWGNAAFGNNQEASLIVNKGGDSFPNYVYAHQFNIGFTLSAAWHYMVAFIDLTTNSNSMVYLDGSATGSTVSTNGSYGPVLLAPQFDPGLFSYGSQTWNGLMDEVRMGAVIPSADRITATYNNQSSPTTFYTIGAASALSGGHLIIGL